MTDVNIPLLRTAVEWAEAEALKPVEIREWEQSYFVADEREVERAKLVLEKYGSGESGARTSVHRMAAKSLECGTCYCIAGYVAQSIEPRYASDEFPDGLPFVAEFAREQLGLSGDEADYLFAGGNTIEDVRRIAEEIAGKSL